MRSARIPMFSFRARVHYEVCFAFLLLTLHFNLQQVKNSLVELYHPLLDIMYELLVSAAAYKPASARNHRRRGSDSVLVSRTCHRTHTSPQSLVHPSNSLLAQLIGAHMPYSSVGNRARSRRGWRGCLPRSASNERASCWKYGHSGDSARLKWPRSGLC